MAINCVRRLIKEWFRSAPVLIAAGLIALLSLTISSPTTAAGLSGPQLAEQPATLVGPRADAPIAIYLRPAPNQPNVGYGISGDAVTVTEQIGDYLSEGDQNATWSHIRLNQAPYTEGWLRGRFLSFDLPPDLAPNTDPSSVPD